MNDIVITVAKSFNFSELAEVSLREFQTKETCTLPENLQPNIAILWFKVVLNSPAYSYIQNRLPE